MITKLLAGALSATWIYLLLRRWRRRVLLQRAWYEYAETVVHAMTGGTRFVVVRPPQGMSVAEAQAVVDAIYENVRPDREDRLVN